MHDNWKTPKKLYDELNSEFNFDFDPCPYSESTPIFDGLKRSWGKSNFVNPPYSRKLKELFILKGIEELKNGKSSVFLIPVSTSSKIFHDVIKKYAKEIRFIKGRIKFEGKLSNGNISSFPSRHDSMLVIFGYESVKNEL